MFWMGCSQFVYRLSKVCLGTLFGPMFMGRWEVASVMARLRCIALEVASATA